MQQWYQCPKCNSPVSYGAQFCNNCSQPLTWQQSQPPPQQPVQTPHYQQQYQQPQQPYQQPEPPKKKTKIDYKEVSGMQLFNALGGAAVFAFLGGWLGPYLLASFITIYEYQLGEYRLLCAIISGLLGATLGAIPVKRY